tara:strand:+ start:8023 stop:8475 length:453 start_codon:yes stop_codon:yes gene_type:complete
MKDTLTDFKNRLLYNAIHKEERSDAFRDKLDEAKRIYKYLKSEYYQGDSSYLVYMAIVHKIIYSKNLIKLCNELQGNGVELQPLVKVGDTYYQDIFKSRIADANKALRSLRPYVLEYCKNMKPEVREKVIDDPKTGKYFKTWFKATTSTI